MSPCPAVLEAARTFGRELLTGSVDQREREDCAEFGCLGTRLEGYGAAWLAAAAYREGRAGRLGGNRGHRLLPPLRRPPSMFLEVPRAVVQVGTA